MTDATSFDHFWSPPPVRKLRDISPFPFVQELIPNKEAFIYDLGRLVENNVDLETNLLWYRVPSLGAVVFFKWQEAPEGTAYEEKIFVTSPTSYDSSEDRFLFEQDVDGTGQLVDVDQEDEILDRLFTLVPCTHLEAQEFYNELISPEGRELLQEEFMEAIGATEDDQEYNDNFITVPYGFSDDEGILTLEEELSWLKDLERAAASDEENDPPASLPSTPVNRVKASLPDEAGYDSSSSEDNLWFKVQVGGRLRNQRSLEDITPTGWLLSMPNVERTGSPSRRRVSSWKVDEDSIQDLGSGWRK